MDGMLCPVLIGRSAEVGALEAALDAAGEGRGGAVFVLGEGGAGKSRLARALCESAADRGFRVMTGRGTQSAVPVPYRPVAEALIGAARGGFTPDMPEISNYRKALGSLVPEWSLPGDATAHVSPVVVAEAVLRCLTEPGAAGGLLVLEDLHWADSETLGIVEYLADNIGDASVLCVVTLRDNVPSASRDLLKAAWARRVAAMVEVPPLTPAAVRQMAAACLAVDEVPADIRALLRDCDGLPFAVEEILAAAFSSGELVRDEEGWHVDSNVSTGVPDSIAETVRSRLGSLGPAAVDVVVSAALLGRQFDWALLPGLAGVGEPDVLDALKRASELQLVEPSPDSMATGTFSFRHSLTRDAILAGLMPAELASRAAATAAAIVRAHPGLPGSWCELVAELYVLAGQPLPAARLLLMSGRRALLKGAVSSAQAVLGNAQRLLADEPSSDPMLGIEVDEVLLEAFGQAGDLNQIAPLADGLIARLEHAGADPRRQALVRLMAATIRPEDRPDAAATHLSVAAAIADQLHDTELASRIDVVAARNALVAGDPDEAERLGLRALASAEAAGLSAWAADVGLESLQVIGRRERMRDLEAARRAFERMQDIADSQGLGIWRIRARHELSTVAMLGDGSPDHLSGVRQLAADVGASCVGTAIELQLANVSSLGEDLDRALDQARKCQKTAGQIHAPRIQAMAACLEASILAIRGGRQETESAAQRAEALLPDDPEILHTTWGQARALVSLFEDEVTRAAEESETAASYARAPHGSANQLTPDSYSALQAPLLAPMRAAALHALLAAVAGGDSRTAIEQARSSGAGGSWNVGWLAYAEAVLAGRDGDAARASTLAEEGAAAFAAFAPWWNHLARRLAAPLALKDGWGQPASWLREAAAGFEATSHDRLASACRGILRQAGQPVPRAGRGRATVPAQMRRIGVTSREMDVFLLVALGESNAAIASKLYISRKTVETHIASLIAKTGMGCRRELVAHAARLDSPRADAAP
jgi:DNA-binding CsgD family transcriptional regulator